jgi:hypothetical protein
MRKPTSRTPSNLNPETFLRFASFTPRTGKNGLRKDEIMKKNVRMLALALSLAALLWGTNLPAQDLHQSYPLSAGSQIKIQNISGDVKIAGYAGNSVVVDAVRSGRDKDLVQIEDLSGGGKLELRVRYPEKGNCEASVTFEVRVPANLEFSFEKLASVSGNVIVGGVRGSIHASSVSGDVLVKDVTGTVSASSVSGSVTAEISQIAGAGDMKFSAVSGSVSIKAPIAGISDVDMSTLSGKLETDFPIQVQEKEFGPGRSARGHVGNGTGNLRISSVSGNISLFKF